MVVFIRGSVGADYPSAYTKKWKQFVRKNPLYQKVRKKAGGEEPQFRFSPRTGLCFVKAKFEGWPFFLERRFISTLIPLFHYTFGFSATNIHNALLPFYLSALRYDLEADTELTEQDLANLYHDEFQISPSHDIVSELTNHGIFTRTGGKIVILPISSVCPPFVHASIFSSGQADTRRRIGEQINFVDHPLKSLGITDDHLRAVYVLLNKANELQSKLLEGGLSREQGTPLEQEIFPLIHRMVDYYLYCEAKSLLNNYKTYLLPNIIGSEEEDEIRIFFEEQRNSSWGYLFHEACELDNVRCIATMLPTVIAYIEKGLFRPFTEGGPYRLMPGELREADLRLVK